MDKIITPAYETKKNGKRGKLTGYIGELRDGETVISSMEYDSYHDAEVALDALAFDILSDMATDVPADELPAFVPSTCVFCHKPHHPQDCPEMRALLFAPDALDTFKQAQKEWADHDCESLSDICTCQFTFKCTQCGKKQTVSGEEMPQYIDIGGKCEACYYEVSNLYAPLDVDFAPVSWEV